MCSQYEQFQFGARIGILSRGTHVPSALRISEQSESFTKNSPRHLNGPPARSPRHPQIKEPRFPASIDCPSPPPPPPPPTHTHTHTPFTPLHAT